LAAEAAKLGLEPAGDDGTWFQILPLQQARLAPGSTVEVAGRTLAPDADMLLFGAVPMFRFGGTLQGEVPTVYGGRLGRKEGALTAEQARGRLIVYDAPQNVAGKPMWQFWNAMDRDVLAASRGALVATLELTPPQVAGYVRRPQATPGELTLPENAPFVAAIDEATARLVLGADPASLAVGTAGRPVRGNVRLVVGPVPTPARNVVAVLRGSDPALRGQYVAIGAHNDHEGVAGAAVDHDSLRAFNTVVRPSGAEDQERAATAEEQVRIDAIRDSLRRIRPPRRDSIYNGADDDGSGSVAVLAIAEALVKARVKPRRSIIFVWHTGEEKGLWGSAWFTDHPTVPRDSIVAQLNMDMVGRGGSSDSTGAGPGGPGQLQLIGSRRLSTELGDLVETVNREAGHGFTFDYGLDADGHPANIYCRSDHYMYARYGIPVAFFTTGVHQDYHMVTDEVEYIDFPKMARISTFVADLALRLANNPAGPVVDKPKPDPKGQCKQ
ncbi:MAG TPA: M28 family peptidase, partial [Gemmatimonadales bacterium]|nr:M28 family peptidase [Gemmatimonadales bacterium]